MLEKGGTVANYVIAVLNGVTNALQQSLQFALALDEGRLSEVESVQVNAK